MPELRKDPVLGRWVIIATERARRPGNFVDSDENYFEDADGCPFCHNKEREIYSLKKKGGRSWRVKVVPSGTPRLTPDAVIDRRNEGLYFVMGGHGVHEVVIEAPEHVANMADLDEGQIRLVIETYRDRFRALEQNTNLQYVIAYKNFGWAAGSRRIGHARSQIIASPVNPLRVKTKLVGAKKYFDIHERCVYCDLVAQEQAEGRRTVLDSEHFLAMTPFAPRFPFETHIIPKAHHCDFHYGVEGREADLAEILRRLLCKIKVGLDNPAYNYMIQTAPFHREKRWNRWNSLEEDYHWHIEVIPRLSHAAGFEKGTGFYICPIPPEDTAQFLREVEI